MLTDINCLLNHVNRTRLVEKCTITTHLMTCSAKCQFQYIYEISHYLTVTPSIVARVYLFTCL